MRQVKKRQFRLSFRLRFELRLASSNLPRLLLHEGHYSQIRRIGSATASAARRAILLHHRQAGCVKAG
ncbi:MAG: hypothetical protein WB622_02465, partial [Acidobacteriaceae bacterium]